MQTPPEPPRSTSEHALLEIEARVTRDSYLLEMAGELDRSTVGMLESHLGDADLTGRSQILMDLGKLAFMDSAGLRALLRVAEREGTRGRVRLVAPSRAVRRVLELTGTEAHIPLAE